MISTPLVNLQSAIQHLPSKGLAAIVVLSKFRGESARSLGIIPAITDRTDTIAKELFGELLLDQFTQSGWCRRDHAPT